MTIIPNPKTKYINRFILTLLIACILLYSFNARTLGFLVGLGALWTVILTNLTERR